MRILITGGGTAGHINPAIAISQEIKKSNPNNSILYIGSKGKMETILVRQAGFPLAEIDMKGLNRKNLFANFSIPFKFFFSYYKTIKIFKYFKPDIVIGTGGYVTLPVILVAKKLKIPSIILEQNTRPGLANKILSRFANKVIVGFEETLNFFPKDKTVFISNPVKKELQQKISKTKAMNFFGFDKKKKTILVLGGSLGASTMNRSVLSHLKTIYDNDIQILWQTGSRYYKKIFNKIPKELSQLILPVPYIENMSYAYACSDLVVARAGAITISELSYLGKPSILVPSPNVSNNHQYKNILPLLEKEAILSMNDKEAPRFLMPNAVELLNEPKILKLLSKNIKKTYDEAANQKILNIIETLPYNLDYVLTSKIKNRFKYVYLLGIGGVGMSGLARWFNSLGLKVYGYDRKSSLLTAKLKEEGITMGYENGIRFIPRELLDHSNKTLVIYTAAINFQHEILKHMKDLGSAVYKRSEILGKLTEETITVAVAGTHGKTTVSAMICHILKSANLPTRGFVGGILKKYESNFIANKKFSKKTITIVEADEYDKSFLKLNPDIEIITSIDPDHLDIYKNEKNLIKSFKEFSQKVKQNGKLILQSKVVEKIYGDKISDDVAKKLLVYDVGFNDQVYNIRNTKNGVLFSFRSGRVSIPNIKMPISGDYNISNALSAIYCCLLLKLTPSQIKQGLETFPGLYRRFDYIINKPNFILINDYAHHPKEIESIISTVKEKYSYKKISVIFQPHLFSRTKDFASGFAKSLSIADLVYLLPIFPAREKPIKNITSKVIYTKISSKKVKKRLVEFDNVIDKLKQDGRHEVVLVLGAGDTDELVESIKLEFDKN